jgi:hypothetical protein
MFGNIEGLCTSTQSAKFTCAGTKVVYNASVCVFYLRHAPVLPTLTSSLSLLFRSSSSIPPSPANRIWGTIGPQRMFEDGQTYSALRWFWLIGVRCPFAFLPFIRKLTLLFLFDSPSPSSSSGSV